RSVPYANFLQTVILARVEGRMPEDVLLPTVKGAVQRVNICRRWFDRASRAAGIEGLTPHELRHTAASLAVSSGANVLALQRMLGHAKPSMTLDTYSDLFDEDLDAVAEGLDAVRAKAVADSLRTGEGLRLVQESP
ncbi:MAG: tyrosine-type recombinase/integrase, partial [Arachnia sp.]